MDITQILVSLLGLVTTVVGTLLVPYLKKKLNAQQQANLAYWVGVAVSAAEGIFNYSQAGKEKYAYVVQFLKDKGLTFQEGEIRTLIESAVYDTINQFKPETEGSTDNA